MTLLSSLLLPNLSLLLSPLPLSSHHLLSLTLFLSSLSLLSLFPLLLSLSLPPALTNLLPHSTLSVKASPFSISYHSGPPTFSLFSLSTPLSISIQHEPFLPSLSLNLTLSPPQIPLIQTSYPILSLSYPYFAPHPSLQSLPLLLTLSNFLPSLTFSCPFLYTVNSPLLPQTLSFVHHFPSPFHTPPSAPPLPPLSIFSFYALLLSLFILFLLSPPPPSFSISSPSHSFSLYPLPSPFSFSSFYPLLSLPSISSLYPFPSSPFPFSLPLSPSSYSLAPSPPLLLHCLLPLYTLTLSPPLLPSVPPSLSLLPSPFSSPHPLASSLSLYPLLSSLSSLPPISSLYSIPPSPIPTLYHSPPLILPLSILPLPLSLLPLSTSSSSLSNLSQTTLTLQ
ncbi:hypothetical protein C7M84_020324 [Penaeus vannamei]|uniref:Uncharacterized protein n=1 Tax=Penaeus vannamei TaxID=6689 RepID=A0A423SCE3_PENVA|nr:hypothetical protein C7M84_020324 [Penaeus vannamei]